MNQDREQQQRTYIIVFFIVMSLIIIGIVALFYRFNGKVDASNPTIKQTTDPISGEQVISPEGKSPETYGVNPDAPIYLGFSNLYDSGLSSDQVTTVKQSLGTYADQIKDKEKVKRISLDPKSISHSIDQKNGTSSYAFHVFFNDKDEYIMKLSSDIVDNTTYSLFKNGQVIYSTTTTAQ